MPEPVLGTVVLLAAEIVLPCVPPLAGTTALCAVAVAKVLDPAAVPVREAVTVTVPAPALMAVSLMTVTVIVFVVVTAAVVIGILSTAEFDDVSTAVPSVTPTPPTVGTALHTTDPLTGATVKCSVSPV